MKPILFNTDMVKAILDGKKTMTRRVVRLPAGISPYRVEPASEYYDDLSEWVFIYGQQIKGGLADCFYRASVPYKLGDILYVRETWNYGYIETSDAEYSHEAWLEEMEPSERGCHIYLDTFARFFYRADEDDAEIMEQIRGIWRPSIHMPKAAARLFLRVTDVRAVRLQDMTAADAYREGIRYAGESTQFEALKRFKALWDSTVKKSDIDRFGWEANPWVWVIEFERCEKPDEKGA